MPIGGIMGWFADVLHDAGTIAVVDQIGNQRPGYRNLAQLSNGAILVLWELCRHVPNKGVELPTH